MLTGQTAQTERRRRARKFAALRAPAFAGMTGEESGNGGGESGNGGAIIIPFSLIQRVLGRAGVDPESAKGVT